MISEKQQNTNNEYLPSVWMFVLFPAVAVLLGWGLRGYIGGGPFAAMIPGCFLAMSMSLLLGYDRNQAVMAALFGTIAIGYGGEMTYGQTLGLARGADTMGWGMLGVTVKGAVWGLLGGAVFGVGMTYRQYDARTVVKGLVLTVLFLFIGWKLVNEPKLIYFSDPVDRPREELWTGLLFAAVSFLAYMHRKGRGDQAGIPLRFALWGMAGGGLGFGGGALLLVYGPSLPVPQEWFGWWKAMEFFFGFMLGGSFGLCAWWYRKLLQRQEGEAAYLPDGLFPIAGLVALVLVYFLAFPIIDARLAEVENAGIFVIASRNIFRPFYTFLFFGAVCIALGLRSVSTAWQVAITGTAFHTIYDLNINWENNNGFLVPWSIQAVIMVVLLGAVGLLTYRLQKRADAVPCLYMLLLWFCYGMACMRSFVKMDYLFPEEGAAGGLAAVLEKHPAILPTHGIFTVSTIAVAVCIWILARQRYTDLKKEL